MLGNTILPQEVTEKMGAEILRLWVASTDYSGELAMSKEILDRVVESYRRIRNTLRFLLANTADFSPQADMLPVEEWLEIDRYALALTRKLQTQAEADYGRFEFHRVVQALQNFASEDLGAVYLDILKDRLYTTQANSTARRAAQSALWHILQSVVKLMAPILSFTAEEIWLLLGKDADDSVMLHTFHTLPAQEGEDTLLDKWTAIRAIRADVQKEIEAVRAAGQVGSSLQAEVEIRAAGGRYDLLASLDDDLRFVLICSKTTLVKAADEAAEAPLMQKHLWHEKASVIMASATLTTHGEFQYIRNTLSAEEVDTVALGSPFDYESSTLLYVANDIPEPNIHGYQQMLDKTIIATAKATGGRMLVLFTSYAALKKTAQAITGPLAREDIFVFEQGEGASPNALLESFKSTDRAVLLGTRSFWEGVDVPGDALSVVFITKLPFDVPSDPIIAARSELYEDSFNEYYLPESILKFRQGFGRLIRSASDRGIVAILDRRVLTKQYGRLFLESLPQCTARQGAAAGLAKMAGQWLGT